MKGNASLARTFLKIAAAALVCAPALSPAQVTVSANFAPGSATDLATPNQNFTIRVSASGFTTDALTAYDLRLNFSASDVLVTGMSDLTPYLPDADLAATPDPATTIPDLEMTTEGRFVDWYTHFSGADLGGDNTPTGGSVPASMDLFDVAMRTTNSPAGAIKIVFETNRRPNREPNAPVYVGAASPTAATVTFDNSALSALAGAADNDGDGVRDALEAATINPPAGVTSFISDDSDRDGLTDSQELNYDRAFASFFNYTRNAATEPNPRAKDTDGDKFLDGLESRFPTIFPNGPLVADTGIVDADGDNLPDIIDPNPASRDSDGDRFNDGYEAAVLPFDDNGDGIPDSVADNTINPRPRGISKLGDVNNDGNLTSTDSLLALRLGLGLTTLANPNIRNPSAADVDGSGGLSATDALLISRAGLGTSIIPPVVQ